MKIVTDHGWPVASDGTDDNAFKAFKNEMDYISQSRGLKTTAAAMGWAAREIERLRTALRCEAESGVCVMVHNPDRPPCTPENCRHMRANG